MMRSIWLVLSLVLTSPLVASDVISDSRRLHLHNLLIQDCGSCHGLTMRGGLGPALLPATLEGKSADYISSVILDGKPGSAMPAWRSLISPGEAYWMAQMLLRGELQ